jgi:hypothetical protein
MKILWHVVCHWRLMIGLGFWKKECSIVEIQTEMKVEITDDSTIIFFSETW